MRWVQFSDLHFNFDDYATNDNFDTETLKQELITTLSNLGKIDFVTITGDCLYRFNESEENIKTLKSFSKEISDACKIKKNQIYLTPGNHDVNRNDTSRIKAIDDILSKKDSEITDAELNKLKNYGYDRFKRIHYDVTNRNYSSNYVIERENYNIINIDTCITSVRNDEEGKLLCVFPKLKLKKNNDEKLNIVIMHHGFDCFRNAWAKRFQNWCEDNKIDIVLCGHSHLAGIRTLDAISTNIKQFTCGAALVDEYAIPSFYVYDYNEATEEITVLLYTFFTDVGRWKLDNSHIRAFNEGKYYYCVSRKGKYIFNDNKNNITIENFVEQEKNIIDSLNKQFRECYGEQFYSSKNTRIDQQTGLKADDAKPEKFDARKAIDSIVKMNVSYTFALEIVNKAINTICSYEYKINTDDIIFSNDFRNVIYQTICEITISEQSEQKIDSINSLASRYARRYGHNSHMFIKKNNQEIELSYSFVSEMINEIILESTGMKKYKITRSEKSSMEEYVMSFLQHLDLHQVDYYAFKNFLKIIITYPPHPWIIPQDDTERIRRYHKNKIFEHLSHLEKNIASLTVTETIYHSSALLVSYYSGITGNTEKFPLLVLSSALNNIHKQKFDNENNNNANINVVPNIYLSEFSKDLYALGYHDYLQLIKLIENLKILLDKPITEFEKNDIKNINKFVDIVIRISDYVENNRNKKVSLNKIIDSNDLFDSLSEFFFNIIGVFTKGKLRNLNNAFWITPNLGTEFALTKGKEQMLVVILSNENYESFLKYAKYKNCNSEDKSIILFNSDLSQYSKDLKEQIVNDLQTEHNIYFFDKTTINRINNSQNKRLEFEKILKEEIYNIK